MTSKFIIKRNRYVDSVSLMSVTDSVKKADGIENCNASMVTAANREILEGLGFDIPADVGANDLVVAVIASDEAAADAALALGQDLLDHKNAASGGKTYDNIEDIDLDEDPYDLVQISLPGEYAAAEAEKALKMGLDVFMFSDNVSLEDEKRLKELAISKGVLMMGPDCGVGYLKGVGLAAGSCYHPGCVGIVGASGSGAQEVGCLVEKLGFGISSLIGTGGRDLYPEIGGIMMLEGIRRLERDPDTKIIILVSKLADLTVMNKVLSFADIVSKPVVAIFLGADEKLYEGHRVYGTYSLEGAAVKAAQLLGAKTHDFGFTDEQIKEIVAREMHGYSAKQKYFRGLYCGGTFTEEGLIYYSSHVKNARLHSNLNTAYAEKLASHLHSEGHSILDLGSEEFTACSPHPVFDPEIRLKRFRQELQDDEVAVILLDFITGPGVAKEPVKEFAIEAKKAIAEKHITVISNICGSAEDPQNIELQAKMLRDAGVIVTDSNYQSARLAAALMSALNERG